jgi:hypothetical protein
MGPIFYSGMTVRNYHSKLCNVPEKRRYHLNGSGVLIPRRGKRIDCNGRNYGLILQLKFKAVRIYFKLILMEMRFVNSSHEVSRNFL